MSKTLKIGLLTPAWPGTNTANGIATSVRHLANGLKNIGHEPIIFCVKIDSNSTDDIKAIEIVQRKWTRLEKISNTLNFSDVFHRVFSDSLAETVSKAKDQYDIDVLITEESFGWSAKISKKNILPVIIFLHGPWFIIKTWQKGKERFLNTRTRSEAKAIKLASAVISPSSHVLTKTIKQHNLHDKVTAVIPNSYKLPEVNLSQRVKDILFVGRFDHNKGGDTVIEAFQLIHSQFPDVRLSFVGPDLGITNTVGKKEYLSDIINMCDETIKNKIIIHGQLGAQEIADLRSTHQIAIIASRFENLNYSLLEAMGAGQTVISTNVGGPSEVITNGIDGILVSADDPFGMANAVIKVLSDNELANSLAEAAVKTIEEKYQPEVVASNLIKFVNGLL